MATATLPSVDTVEQLLGDQAASLLEHRCETVDQSMLHLPCPDFF
jgi:fructose-bisphosphate aldolase, class I